MTIPIKAINILLLLLFCATAHTQYSEAPITEIEKNIYTDGTTEGKLHKFGHLFQSDPEQIEAYTKFNQNRKAQRWVNYISSAIVTGGLIDGLRDGGAGTDLILRRLKTPLTYAIVIGGLGNWITGRKKSSDKKSILSHYALSDTLTVHTDKNIERIKVSKNFIQLSNRRFQSDSIIGPLHKYEYMFSDEPQLSHEFNQYNSYRKKQITSNVIGLTIVTASIVGGFAIANSGNGSTPDKIGGANVIVVGGGVGLFYILFSNLSNGSKKSKHKAALLSMIDVQQLGLTKPSQDIDLAITQDGLGLVYRF